MTTAPQPETFRDWAAEQLAERRRRILRRDADGIVDTAELHQFRIRAKALRYAIELVAAAFDPELRKKLYPLVEELQERLGRFRITSTAAERCRNWATEYAR